MPDSIKRALEAALSDRCYLGQILIQKANDGFVLSHRDDEARNDSQTFRNAEEAVEIAKYNDAGNYRPLKTAPNLRHGWRLTLKTLEELKHALDYFYPGRLAVFAAWKTGQLRTTNLRDTLDRQSGMYRVAAKISDAQIDDLVARFLQVRRRLFADNSLETRCSTARSRQQNCQRKSLIPRLIKRKRGEGRGHLPSPTLEATADKTTPATPFRCFARNHAICSWQNAEKL